MSDKELVARYRMALEAILKVGINSSFTMTAIAREALKEKE